MGIGAYFAIFAITRFHLPFLVGLIGGGLVAGIVALILSYPFLRVKGVYFFLITLTFLEMFRIAVSNYWRDWFNGADGIYGLPAPTIGGFQFTSLAPLYYLCVVLLLITFAICWRIEKSWSGSVLLSIQDADMLSRCVGINIILWKAYVFVIGCSLAGVAGGIFAFLNRGVNPNNFGFAYAVDLQVFVLVGGMGAIWGPLLGALLLGGLGDFFRGIGEYALLVNGSILVLITLFQPTGLIAFPSRIRQMIRRLRRAQERYEDGIT
jgi:branched-chain amino acid transport system permease protein